MTIIVSFLIYSLIGLSLTYILRTRNFLKLIAICNQEGITVINFKTDSSDRLLKQADIILKYTDMYKSFGYLTKFAVYWLLVHSIIQLITK